MLDPQAGPISVYPDLRLPRAVLTAFTGDLGVDDGTPQSVYSLDKRGMTQVTGDERPEPGAVAGARARR